MLKRTTGFKDIDRIFEVQFHEQEKMFYTDPNTSQDDESVEEFYIIYDGGNILERGQGEG